MNIRRQLRLIGLFAVLGVVSLGQAHNTQKTFYGEPVELKSNYIYFTSWKYVRQGSFTWKVVHAPGTTEAQKLQGSWLKGDSDSPARFSLALSVPVISSQGKNPESAAVLARVLSLASPAP